MKDDEFRPNNQEFARRADDDAKRACEGANPLNYATKLYVNGELLTYLVIPEGVIEINSYVFEDFKGITSLQLNLVNSLYDKSNRPRSVAFDLYIDYLTSCLFIFFVVVFSNSRSLIMSFFIAL